MDTLTTSATTQDAGSEPDRLPRGSALLCETILNLARQIRAADDLAEIKAMAASIEIQAGELVAKVRRQIGVAA